MSDTKPCPECGEEIQPVAIKCRFCGVALNREAVEEARGSRGPIPAPAGRRASCLWILLCVLGGWIPTYEFAYQGRRGLAYWGAEEWGGVAVALAGIALLSRDVARPKKKPLLWGWSLPAAVFMIGFLLLIPLATGDLTNSRRLGTETLAIGSLKTIGTAQSLFREADKEADGNLDYGTLKELAGSGGSPGLVDSVLGNGTKNGYVFETTYGSSTSEFLWFATARPVSRAAGGDRYFCANHEGVVFYTTAKAFALNSADCSIPGGALPVGR